MTTTRPRRRHGKALIALLATTAALAGGTQAFAPTSASAMVHYDMTEAECNAEFGIWSWFESSCDVNFGGSGSGGPSYGGVGGGGGGSSDGGNAGGGGGGNSPESNAPKTPEELAKARAEEEKRQRELRELKDSLERALREFQRLLEQFEMRGPCERLKAREERILGEIQDSHLLRKLRGGSRKERAEEIRGKWLRRGCGQPR